MSEEFKKGFEEERKLNENELDDVTGGKVKILFKGEEKILGSVDQTTKKAHPASGLTC